MKGNGSNEAGSKQILEVAYSGQRPEAKASFPD
jgi:hypothetical protein